MEIGGYVPPLPIGFGWSSEEEDDSNDELSDDNLFFFSQSNNDKIIKNTSDEPSKVIYNNSGNKNFYKIWQIEKLVEDNLRIDQQNNNLINFNKSGTIITFEGRNDFSSCSSTSLPLQSIAYDYTCLPLRIVEQERKFLPLIGEISSPFLRPIIADGIGLIKAYWEGCSDDDYDEYGSNSASSYLQTGNHRSFPMVPIIRCLFYWVSRGHLTRLCFPFGFNPIGNRQEYAVSDQDLKSLKLLETYGLALFFEANFDDSVFPNQKWFTEKRDSLRACLITCMSHYIEGMPSSLHQDFNYKTWSETTCSERTLQPYYGPRGDMVFFSPIKEGKKEFVADTVLDNDIKTETEFDKFECFQLRFIDQAKYLKILYELLPKEKRAQEAHVMVALLNRLEWHLTN